MEALQRAVGGCGRFQWMMVMSLKLALVPMSWSMLQMAFSGMVPDWWCLPSSDYHGNVSASSNGYRGNWSRGNVTYQACGIPGSGGESCESHVVFDDSVKTVINEWSLVCDRKYIKAMLTSLQMAGVFIGAVVAGQSCDAIGRRKTCYAALLWHFVTSLVAGFSVNWQMFLAMRILIGVSLGAYFVASFPYCFEFINPQHRQLVAFTPGWNVGVMLFALGSWLLRDWSYMHIGSAILTIPFLLTWFVIPESARWLATKGRLQEAERVVQYVARVNRRPLPHNTLLTLQHVALEEEKVGQGRRYTYLDVYRGCRMAVTTLILNFLWCSLSFTYYGISFGISALSGSFYFNMFLMEIVNLPVCFSVVYIGNRLGRRWTCFSLFTLAALFSFSILAVEKTVSQSWKGTVTSVLAMVSRAAIEGGWMTTSTLSSELYPTVVRNLGYGTCNTVARIGGALAPVVLNMDTADDVVRAYIIVGSIMGICGVMTLFLRETKGQGLQDSIINYEKEINADKVKADGENETSLQQSELPVWTVEKEKDKDEGKTEKGNEQRNGGGKTNEERSKTGEKIDNGKERKEEGNRYDGEKGKDELVQSKPPEIFTVRL